MAKVKVIYKLARPYDESMSRAVDRVYSTKGIHGVRFQGLSTVEIEYDTSRLGAADVDRILQMAGMPGEKKEPELFEEGPALTAAGKAFYALTQEEDWSKAAGAYSEAYELCGTRTVKELALRGEVCMWYGFALKNLYDLEAISDRNPPSKAQLKAALQIKFLWTEMLEIYEKIPYEAHRMDAKLVQQIRGHWIMPE